MAKILFSLVLVASSAGLLRRCVADVQRAIALEQARPFYVATGARAYQSASSETPIPSPQTLLVLVFVLNDSDMDSDIRKWSEVNAQLNGSVALLGVFIDKASGVRPTVRPPFPTAHYLSYAVARTVAQVQQGRICVFNSSHDWTLVGTVANSDSPSVLVRELRSIART